MSISLHIDFIVSSLSSNINRINTSSTQPDNITRSSLGQEVEADLGGERQQQVDHCVEQEHNDIISD